MRRFKTIASLALIPLLLSGCFKMTGGGQFSITSGSVTINDTAYDLGGDQATIAFVAQPINGTLDSFMDLAKGELQIVDRTSGILFHGVLNQTLDSSFSSPGDTSGVYWGTGNIRIGNTDYAGVDFQLTVFLDVGGSVVLHLDGGSSSTDIHITSTLDAGALQLHVQ